MSEFPFRRRLDEPTHGSLSPHLEPVREYCLAKVGVTEEFPFGPEVMVFKVGGKIFAIVAWEKDPLSISLKCQPTRALELRDEYAAITPGYHLSKKHWNSVLFDEYITSDLIDELIDHSYDLVFASLSKKLRESLD